MEIDLRKMNLEFLEIDGKCSVVASYDAKNLPGYKWAQTDDPDRKCLVYSRRYAYPKNEPAKGLILAQTAMLHIIEDLERTQIRELLKKADENVPKTPEPPDMDKKGKMVGFMPGGGD